MPREWLDLYTWAEIEALTREDREIERVRWQHTSIVAAAAMNAQRSKKDKQVPWDAFVPKDESSPAKTPKQLSEVERLRKQLAQIDLAFAMTQGYGGVISPSAIEKRKAVAERLRELTQ